MDDKHEEFIKNNPLDYAWEYDSASKEIYRNHATPYFIREVPNPKWTGDQDHPRSHVFEVGIEIENEFQWVATCLQVAMAIKVVKELQRIDDDMGCEHGPCAWGFP